MISLGLADIMLVASLLITILAYVKLSRMEGSYINILLPALIIGIPAYYVLPWVHAHLFGIEASRYAFSYVYATLAVENVAFVYAYVRTRGKVLRLPFRFSYRNFGLLAYACLGFAVLIYLPVLLQFREYLLNPREIYERTRTGFGPQFYISSIVAYVAIILILFTRRSWLTKTLVITLAAGLLALHGSKDQVLNVAFLLALFYVYVARRKVTLVRASLVCLCIGLFVLLMFAVTMSLGGGSRGALESISEYSDYTRNAMMVIDEHFPMQYGRLTIESNTIVLFPRTLMPDKPKNIGPMRLDEEFYSERVDMDRGAPAFGVGVQYADFGALAIVYVALFAALRGWLARVFVNRLQLMKHPADFFLVAFMADVALFPVGGAGWLVPEALLVALFLRRVSRIGPGKVYRDPPRRTSLPQPVHALRQGDSTVGL